MVSKKQDESAEAVEAATAGLGGEVVLSNEQLMGLSSIQPRVDDMDLRNISSYDEAVALAEAVHGAVLDISEEIGTGFSLLEDKAKLEKVAFVVLTWRFTAGDFGSFASMALVTTAGDKYIVNDGSTGIHDQLKALSSEKRVFGALRVPNGLRVSDYTTCPACGKPMTRDEVDCSNDLCNYSGEERSVGQTYYLDTSPARA